MRLLAQAISRGDVMMRARLGRAGWVSAGRRAPVSAVLAVLAALSAAPGLASPAAPRLTFTDAELALAQGVLRDPGLAAFYGGNGLRQVFTGPESRARRAALLAAVRTAPEHGLPAARYQPERLAALALIDDADPAIEAELAGIFALWVHDVSAGILDPRKLDSTNKREAEGVDLAALLTAFASAPDPARVLAGAEPQAPQYQVLKRALAAQRGTSAPEGTPPAPEGKWKIGARDPRLADLRARLVASGIPLAPAAAPEVYDTGLATAVAEYQRATGLPDDGIAGPRTIARLNAPPSAGPRELLVAMERWRWLPDDLDEGQDRHIWVNLPSYTAQIVSAAGDVTFDTKVVIGKAEHDLQTPEFSDRMEFMVANPRWNVPRSITVKEYLPRLKKNRNAASQLDIINRAGKVIPRDQIDFSQYTEANFPYRMRQKPSDDNALGQVKFMFPNPWNIYLHDTPSKGLFGESARAFSHGCVRVARPIDLAHALLSGQTDSPEAVFSKALAAEGERYINLKPPVPVHLVYFTTLPDAGGRMRRYPDVYGRDGAVWAALSAALDEGAGEKLATAD